MYAFGVEILAQGRNGRFSKKNGLCLKKSSPTALWVGEDLIRIALLRIYLVHVNQFKSGNEKVMGL